MNGALNKLVKHAARRVGIRKRIYPYLFRHSRATFLASRLTEAQMNAVFGWQQGSDMPRTYVHLSGRDVDAALLQLAGVASADAQPRESILKPRVCVRCSLGNPGTARFCSRCAAPLDSAEIMKFEDDALAAGRLVTDLLQNDPLLQAMVKERLKRKLMEEREASATPAPAMESRT
jgi:ribosomal protein L40E